MDLLEKASIILTPTAYNNGEALCVKPSDGSGDFDFSRNSAATRVNAQGLVENVQHLGSELITIGNDTSDIVGLSDNQNINIQTSFLTLGKTVVVDFGWVNPNVKSFTQMFGEGVDPFITFQNENVDFENSGLSKREWNELMTAFDIKDKLI